MASQLTSVRFDDDLLDDARLVAEADDDSVAEVIRAALRGYVRTRLADPSVQMKLRTAHDKRESRLQRYAEVAHTAPVPPQATDAKRD